VPLPVAASGEKEKEAMGAHAAVHATAAAAADLLSGVGPIKRVPISTGIPAGGRAQLEVLPPKDLKLQQEEEGEEEELEALIRRDCFERYLFMRKFGTSASEIWSPVLAWATGSAIIIAILCYISVTVIFHVYDAINVYVVVALINSTGLVLSVFLVLANANSAMDDIQDMFVNSAADDFAVIGGRSLWLDYIGNMPIQWTVYGFVIDFTLLLSLISSLVLGAMGLIIPALLFTVAY
jgi:hypothetical protein